MDSFKNDTNTFSCAVGYFSGISPQSVSITGVSSSTVRLLADTSTVVEFALTFDMEPYSFPSPLAAYEAVNVSLSNAVLGGRFTKLINLMSEVYAPPVHSDVITVYPFSAAATVQPSPRQKQLNVNVADSSGASVDVTLWASIAAGVLVLLVSIGGAICYMRWRRVVHQGNKDRALNDLTSFNMRDREVQPETGDIVEWASVWSADANASDLDASRNMRKFWNVHEAQQPQLEAGDIVEQFNMRRELDDRVIL